MKKWIFCILIFGSLFVFAVFSLSTIIANLKGFFFLLSRAMFFTSIFLIPVWIYSVSIRRWRFSTKKIFIVAMVIVSAGTSIYGTLRSHPDSSLNLLGQVVLVLYFVAAVSLAYFNWPGRHKDNVKVLIGAPKRRYVRKNRTFITVPKMIGADGDATVTFINAIFQKVNESKKKYPDPNFGAWLIEQIYNEKKIMAERRGWGRKILFCSSCGTELNPEL